MEKTIEKDRVVCMAFVDLEKAYDNVNRLKLWKVLEELVFKEDYYEQFRHWMRMERQVRGLLTMPWLFNVLEDKVTRGARRELVREVKLSTGDVGCVDDMVLMAESAEGLQSSLQALSEAMGRWDLK